MSFEKITSEDRANKGNVGLPDTPNLSTTDMQERMDSLPNLVIEKFNELIDVLNSVKAATSVGATVPEGITAQPNVQSILNAMVLNLKLNTENRHSHSNKAVLDTVSQELLDSYSRVVLLLAGILSVEASLTGSETAIPTSSAVSTFVANYNITTKVRDAAYPVGCIYLTKGTSPASLFGGSWNLLETDTDGTKKYERTA